MQSNLSYMLPSLVSELPRYPNQSPPIILKDTPLSTSIVATARTPRSRSETRHRGVYFARRVPRIKSNTVGAVLRLRVLRTCISRMRPLDQRQSPPLREQSTAGVTSFSFSADNAMNASMAAVRKSTKASSISKRTPSIRPSERTEISKAFFISLFSGFTLLAGFTEHAKTVQAGFPAQNFH